MYTDNSFVHQISILSLIQTYSSYDSITMFLQELGFEFWQEVQCLPHGVYGHFNLYQSSFEEDKTLLKVNFVQKDVIQVIQE